MAEPSKVIGSFIDEGMHLTPSALDLILNREDSDISRVISNLNERKDRPNVVTDEVLSRVLESDDTITTDGSGSTLGSEESDSGECEEVLDTDSDKGKLEDKEDETLLREDLQISKNQENLEVLREITGKSTTEGRVEDFVQLFRDRYEKLSSMIRSREGFQNYTKMENVVRHEGDVINLVGLVNSKRETRNKDAWLIELEDLTGEVVVYIKDSDRNEEVIENIDRVVTDEVIGVKAKVPDDLKSGNRTPLVWGNKVIWPDIPLSSKPSLEKENSETPSGYAVLISDLHVGSGMFLPKVFEKFIEWLNCEAGNEEQREIAKQVKYLIIAGDLVDGIGIYPGQQKELEIENIEDQYKKVADYLSRVPDRIDIIAGPGNHDAGRLAEPQPCLYSEVARPLRDVGVKLVGNPAFLDIEGVKFLVYHGMGFDDLFSAVSGLDRKDVVTPMKEILIRRHLAPIYGEPMGGRTPIAPEKEDYLVIDDVPDVLHCGHLHRYGCGEYRGVLMVNSATFQEQTIFMKRQGIVPTPGRVPIVNLETKEARAINFA